jgi:hypothetical protein
MPKMRAMVVPQAGAKFNLEERDLPEPDRHEVRINVHACGVCHSDTKALFACSVVFDGSGFRDPALATRISKRTCDGNRQADARDRVR